MEKKKNTGAMFVNDKKEADNHPDYKGTVDVEGKEYSIAVWERTSKAGKPYLSIMLSEPFKKSGGNGKPSEKKSDLPF